MSELSRKVLERMYDLGEFEYHYFPVKTLGDSELKEVLEQAYGVSEFLNLYREAKKELTN